MSSTKPPSPPQAKEPLDITLIIGLVFAGLTYYLHTVFTDLEMGVIDSVRIHWIIALLYNILGHIPTIALLALLSLGTIVVGIRKLIARRD